MSLLGINFMKHMIFPVEVNQLYKRFRGQTVVHQLSFQLARGQILGFHEDAYWVSQALARNSSGGGV